LQLANHTQDTARARLSRDQFIFNNEHTRQMLTQQVENAAALIYPAHLYAPFDGIITVAMHVTENLVTQFPVVFTISEASYLMRTTQPASVLQGMHFGDVFTLRNQSRGITMEARVVNEPHLSSGHHAFWLLPLNPPPMDEVVGLTFTTQLTIPLVTDGILVPANAVRTEGHNVVVFQVIDDQIHRREVSAGIRHNNYVHILSGVTPDMVLAVLP